MPEALCTGCNAPMTKRIGLNTCSTQGCPGNLHTMLDGVDKRAKEMLRSTRRKIGESKDGTMET